MNPDVFLAVTASYLMVAVLGYALGQLSAKLQHRHAHEIDRWPALPGVESGPAYDWAREEGLW